MKIENIDVDKAVDHVRELLKKEQDLSPALSGALEVLLLLVSVLLGRVTLNSQNSSKPPSSDQNREKRKKEGSGNKPGGQKGRTGKNLKPVDDPDQIKVIAVDQSTLPPGEYVVVGFEKRQVVDIDVSRTVTEYQAQVLRNEKGCQFTASFPEGIDRPIQYGASVKAHAVYLSQFQLIPYDRIRDYFDEQLQMPVSSGSLFNFNQAAYEGLNAFDGWIRKTLTEEELLHADETGVNIGGKRHWIHCHSSDHLTYLYPHAKRGTEAMDEVGVLSQYKGVLCHDHWKPYYRYDCAHALCNAHHLRELERAWEQDKQKWAQQMKQLLLDMNVAVDEAGGALSCDQAKLWRARYRALLEEAEIECPPPDESQRKERQRGRLKRSKSRNLLERLLNFELDVLRFLENKAIPFTNNQGERDLRMTKVQQKISGCFRSMDGAKIFCRVRSYISTCRKQRVSATDALTLLFEGKMPEFIQIQADGE